MLYYVLVHYSELNFGYLMILICILFIPLISLLIINSIQRMTRFITCYVKKVPAIILTQKELIDNIDNKCYKWNEIEKISMATYLEPNSLAFDVIVVKLYDSNNLIYSIRNPFKRYIARYFQNKYGSTYLINTNPLKCKRKKLFEELNKYLKCNRELNSC